MKQGRLLLPYSVANRPPRTDDDDEPIDFMAEIQQIIDDRVATPKRWWTQLQEIQKRKRRGRRHATR